MTTPGPDLIHAYRRLLRAGLRAVQFSQPSRSTITARLREGFRDPRGEFDAERVRRTVWFLNAAAQQRGLEHKILKNLCRVHWERTRQMPWRVRARSEGLMMSEGGATGGGRKGGRLVFSFFRSFHFLFLCSFSFFFYTLFCIWGPGGGRRVLMSKRDPDVIKGTEYEHYDRTIEMLNDTMGLCLR